MVPRDPLVLQRQLAGLAAREPNCRTALGPLRGRGVDLGMLMIFDIRRGRYLTFRLVMSACSVVTSDEALAENQAACSDHQPRAAEPPCARAGMEERGALLADVQNALLTATRAF